MKLQRNLEPRATASAAQVKQRRGPTYARGPVIAFPGGYDARADVVDAVDAAFAVRPADARLSARPRDRILILTVKGR
jgi:hypothetical protein